jgi:Plasmid replication region DNA-binding N-term
MFPLESVRCTIFAMNRRLADHRIRSTCRELLASGARLTGRGLRRELRNRYGAVGQTARVFQIWREESAASQAPQVPADVAQMAERMHAAEAAAAAASARAERAELREEAHQTRWAMEIDGLRQQLRAQPQYAAEIRRLQDQVMRLTVELHAARRQLAHPSSTVD